MPKNTDLIEKYEDILKTKVPNAQNARVCGRHFKNGKRESPSELPISHIPPASNSEHGPICPKRKAPTPRGPVPPPKPRNQYFNTYKERMMKKQLIDKKQAEINNLNEQLVNKEIKIQDFQNLLQESTPNTGMEHNKVDVCEADIIRLQNELQEREFNIERFINDDIKMVFYTGLNSEQFNSFWEFVEPEISTPKRKGISRKNELFAVLVKLRLGLQYEDLADRSGLSRQTVSRLFEGWLTFLSSIVAKINLWPSIDYIDKYLPNNFKPKYSMTRVILDCTEIKVQRASNCDLQSMHFSSYKNCATVKGFKFFVCLHGDKTYNSFVCGNTT